MFILNLFLMAVTIFASFKLAEEKGQNVFVWPFATALVGVLVFIIQYLVSVYWPKKNMV